MAARIFSPMAVACATEACGTSLRLGGSITTNSSPPRRATVSPSRTQATSRLEACLSSASPRSWPRVSLICLKRSMSMNISAPSRLERWHAVSACCSRSFMSLRLGRSVSGSKNASCAISRSRSLRSVMSTMVPT